MKQLKDYKKAMKNKEVLRGLVKLVQFDKELNTDILAVDLGDYKGVMVRDEIDIEINWKSLVGFVGREVSFIVTSIDEKNKTIYCSRKEAQIIKKEEILERLKEGEIFNAQIVNILKYGAYIEVEGISGLLKNVDFAEDYTTVEDILKIGDNINVKLKKISANDKLIFEAIEKYKNPTIMGFDMFERDQVVLGVVRNVKPWGIYVCIAPGLDALCPVPGTGEIEDGMKVSFRITQVKPEEKRIRGKIIRLI